MRAARALREEETVADCEYAERHQDSGRSRSYRPFGVWGQITWACARRTRSAQAIKLRAFSPNSSRPTIGSNRWAEARGNIPVLWDNVMFLNRSYGKRSISSFLEGRRVGISQCIFDVPPRPHQSGSRAHCANFSSGNSLPHGEGVTSAEFW